MDGIRGLFLGFTCNYENTVVAETKGSNGFYKLQTFEQKLLATAYEFLGFLEILGFLLMLQVKF